MREPYDSVSPEHPSPLRFYIEDPWTQVTQRPYVIINGGKETSIPSRHCLSPRISPQCRGRRRVGGEIFARGCFSPVMVNWRNGVTRLEKLDTVTPC